MMRNDCGGSSGRGGKSLTDYFWTNRRNGCGGANCKNKKTNGSHRGTTCCFNVQRGNARFFGVRGGLRDQATRPRITRRLVNPNPNPNPNPSPSPNPNPNPDPNPPSVGAMDYATYDLASKWAPAMAYCEASMCTGPPPVEANLLSETSIEVLSNMTLVAHRLGLVTAAAGGATPNAAPQDGTHDKAQSVRTEWVPLFVVRAVQLLLWHRHPALPSKVVVAAHHGLYALWEAGVPLSLVGRLILQVGIVGEGVGCM